MRKDTQRKYIIDSPIVIEAPEKRIVENCLVEVSAPIAVHGKLVFRNCTLKNISGKVDIYGVLKLEACHIWTDACFLNIQPSGLYQCDVLDFNDNSDNFGDYISGLKKERFSWIENPPPAEKHFLDVLISCVSKYYDVEISGECPKEYSDNKRKIRKTARCIALYINREMGLPWYEIICELGIPHWFDGVFNDLENVVLNGDIQLWKEIATISMSVLEEIYWYHKHDQREYPYRD